ncbi:MAG: hypothetical protein AB1758_12365 [Candidatus Eremiobacterota bacterium]
MQTDLTIQPGGTMLISTSAPFRSLHDTAHIRIGPANEPNNRRAAAARKGGALVAGTVAPGAFFAAIDQPVWGLAIGATVGACVGASIKSPPWVKSVLVVAGAGLGTALAILGTRLEGPWIATTLVAGTIVGAGLGYVCQAMADSMNGSEEGRL